MDQAECEPEAEVIKAGKSLCDARRAVEEAVGPNAKATARGLVQDALLWLDLTVERMRKERHDEPRAR